MTSRMVLVAATLALVAAPAGEAEAVNVFPTLSPATPNGANGWYVAPVTVTWHASGDALDTTCPAVQTLDQDTPGTQLTCTAMGPLSASSTAATPVIRIDRTPPALGAMTADARLGRATLRWAPPADAIVSVARAGQAPGDAPRPLSPASVRPGVAVERGLAPGVRYTWLLTAMDAAGNTSTAVASASWRPPVLRWNRRRGARYYNVQLFRGRKKVLSAWPRRTRLALDAGWRFAGRRRHLGPGRYRWYVWPGYGPRAAKRYGRMAARGRFIVR